MPPAKRKHARKSKKPAGLKSQALGFLKEVLFILTAVLVINSFVLASFEVPTGSMENTVMIGDRLLVNKFVYGGSTPYTIPLTSIRIPHFRVPGLRSVRRGDVIVFDWPGERDQVEKPRQMWYLKRCIGLPGDTVEIDRRVVRVNGKVFPDPPHVKYLRPPIESRDVINPDLFPRGARFNQDNYGPIQVPRKGEKIALGSDNFRAWQVFIRREGHSARILGSRVLIDDVETPSYTVARDYVFAMGDSRDDSLDSRFWGFVPVEDVIGTPLVVYWSWDPYIPIYRIFDKLGSVELGRIGTLIR